MMEYLNEQYPYHWIGRGGPQNWLLWSVDLPPLDFHEKHGALMQSKQKRGTTSSNFQWWKMHES
jgi:hypothetical protein